MSNFDLEKIKEELSVYDPLMPCVVKALRVIGRLCEEGQKLERQRDWLAKKCEELSDDPEDFFMPYNIPAKEWIERAEQATKEAGKSEC